MIAQRFFTYSSPWPRWVGLVYCFVAFSLLLIPSKTQAQTSKPKRPIQTAQPTPVLKPQTTIRVEHQVALQPQPSVFAQKPSVLRGKLRQRSKMLPAYRVFHAAIAPIVEARTDLSGTSGKVTLTIDLGMPKALPILSKLSGAPDSRQFSNLTWSNFNLLHLPSGVTITNVGGKGAEAQPVLNVNLALPTGTANVAPFETGDVTADLKNIYLSPTPTVLNDSTSLTLYNSSAYSNFVTEHLGVSSAHKFRSVHFVTLRIPLVQIAAGGTLLVKKGFRAGVTFSMPSSASSAIAANSTRKFPDPLFSQVEHRMVANTNDLTRFAGNFRLNGGKLISSPKGKKLILGADTTQPFDLSITTWIDRNAPYVKLSVSRTGLYRVTAQEISTRVGSRGLDVSSWLAGSVRLFNHGQEVPMWVDTSRDGHVNAIEFYGTRLPGFPNEYFNIFTDTNAYWLTNSTAFSTTPLRYKLRAPSLPPSSTLTSGNVLLHHERDKNYYPGDTFAGGDDSRTVQRTEWIPGRKWEWAELDPPNGTDTSHLIDTFFVDGSLGNTSATSATLGVFLRGISETADLMMKNHEYRISINGTEIAQDFFAQYDSIYITQSIPLTLLHQGANTFEVQSVRPADQNGDRFYIDFYNLQLNEAVAPSSDTCFAKGQVAFSEIPPSTLFGLQVASTDGAQLFNLTDTTRLANATTNTSNTLFSDSTTSGVINYIASSNSGLLHVDQIYDWNAPGFPGWTILDTTRGADFIILTHPVFMAIAQKDSALRANQTPSLRIKIVSTDEVFNAFNFGSNEPWSIRQFLHYAYDFYAGTPPGFVTLLGDATWDPKFNRTSPRTTRQTFVPSFGDPVSDYIYTTFGSSSFDSIATPTMVIARIPAATPLDASRYFDKLLQYETDQPAQWNKNFLFVIGGDLANNQHGEFMSELQAYLQSPPFGGIQLRPMTINPITVERTDYSGGVDYTHESDIQQDLRSGASLMYFSGHGAPQFSDVSFGDPNQIRNSNLYTTLITLSCRTGDFGEPDVLSINQSFVNATQSGAILSLGTTGFGVTDFDLYTSQAMWLLMDADSLNNLGGQATPRRLNMPSIFTLAKVLTYLGGQAQSFAYEGENSLNQYTTLGDAMTGFILRPEPELAALASDLEVANSSGAAKTVFSLSDTLLAVKATVRNFGYSAEGKIDIRFRDVGPKGIRDTIISLLNGLDTAQTVTGIFPLDTNAIGQHTISVFIDYDSLYRESNENDNIATEGIIITGSTVTPLYPPEGARSFCDVNSDSVLFLMLTPNVATQSVGGGTLELQIDTTSQFSNPRELVKGLQVKGSLVQFTVSKSQLPASSTRVLWWRSQYTSVSGKQGAWQVGSFSLDQSTPSEFSYTTADQLSATILGGLRLTSKPSLALPFADTLRINVVSHGSNDSNIQAGNSVSQLYLNEKAVVLTKDSAVMKVVEFSQDGISIKAVDEFINAADGDQHGQDSLALLFDSVITAIPAGEPVIVFTNNNPYMKAFDTHPAVIAAMHSLGAATGFGLVSYFGSYALIGQKGAPAGSAREATGQDGGAGVTLFDTIIAFEHYGAAQTPFTAVATHYGALKWKGVAPSAASTILFTILGHSRLAGSIDTLQTFNATSASSFALDTIDPRLHDKLSVLMQFVRDSTETLTPELYSIELEYQPAPELAITPLSLIVSPKDVQEGYPVVTSYQIQNLTCVPVVKLLSELTIRSTGHNDTLRHSGLTLLGHRAVTVVDTVNTFGKNGTSNLTANVNPDEAQNEQYLLNNTDTSSFVVSRDSTKPQLDVLFDGRHVYNCDYVSGRDTITMGLKESAPIRQTDSTSISAILTNNSGIGTLISLSTGSPNQYFDLKFIPRSSGSVQAQLVAIPQANQTLGPGQWTLTAAANDASGNKDTVSVCFTVANSNGLDHVMNVPNPFKDFTSFTYQLRTGGAADVKIVIYTVAGRKIRTLTPDPANPPHAGINFIAWDGRDQSGNIVANGTYLYRVVLAGTNPDGSQASDAVSERAVKSK